MTDMTRKPLREHLNERLAALNTLHTLSHLTGHPSAALPGSTVLADYKTVLSHLEAEALQAIAAAATELRKPTVADLVDRLWSAGPLTFEQIRDAFLESGVPAGEVETLLNRLRNAGLLTSSESPHSPAGQAEVTRRMAAPSEDAKPADVTSSYSQLVTSEGRAWFDARARDQGIDQRERINCQF